MTQPAHTSAVALSFQAFKGILPIILLAVLGHLVIGILLQSVTVLPITGALLGSAVTAPVAFAAHNYVVSGRTRRGFRALQTEHKGAFVAFLALSFFMVLAFHGIGWLIGLGVGNPPVAEPSLVRRPPSSTFVLLVFASALVTSAAMLFVTGAFGTMFPAIVDGGDTRPRTAWNRGVKWAIASRMIGAFLLVVLGMVVVTAVLFYLLGGPGGIIGSVAAQTVLAAVNLLVGFYLTTLIATILSKAYLGSYTPLYA